MTTTIGFLVFPGMQLLDMAGPYEVYSSLSDCDIRMFWKTREPVTCSAGMRFYPTSILEDALPMDVLCIPGGVGINQLLTDEQVITWVQQQALSAQLLTAVCTGSLLFGIAGLLKGRRATTHWRYRDLLTEFGAISVKGRVVRDGNLITSTGVTSGIDLGLVVAEALRGQAAAEEVQLAMEYMPEPPFQAGNPETAPENIVEMVRHRTRNIYAERARIIEQWKSSTARS